MKLLQGVAHDIGHHAQSSLSWLHPHLSQACRVAQLDAVEVRLTDANPYPSVLAPREPLRLALAGLRERFWQILQAHQLERSTVAEARLTFSFREDRSDDYSSEVRAVVVGSNGRAYEAHFALP
jgi:hypothetical protein